MGRIQDALKRAQIMRDVRRTATGPDSVVVKHLAGSRAGESEPFHRETILIGRGPGCDVRFDSFAEPTVSSHHAEFRREGPGWVVYDLGSLNGTYVGGVQVSRCPLEPGDEVSLGRTGPVLTLDLLSSSAP